MSRSLTDAQLECAFAGSVLGVNRFYVTAGPQGVRIAFGEEGQGRRPRFVTGVLMTTENARELGKLLMTMAERAETPGAGNA